MPALAAEGPVVAALRAAWPQALAIYAFGSRITGAARPDSDLDLAVLVPGYADPLCLWDMAGELAGRLDCEVDLLDLRAASTVMQHQVLTHGQRLWPSSRPRGCSNVLCSAKSWPSTPPARAS